MFWYLVICMLMLYPLRIVQVGNLFQKKTQQLALVWCCCILWFFMAMRATSVGVDTKYYCYVFTQYGKIPFSEVFTAVTYATESKTWAFDFEPGYRLVNKLLTLISTAPQTITIFNSTLIMVLLYKLVRRNSDNFLLSMWLYLTLGIFQTQMNVTRNAIAILIVYNSFVYIERRSPVKYVLCCAVASLFHVAALVFVPLYWIHLYFRPTRKNCALLVGLFLLVGLLFPVVSPLIRMVLPSSLDKYFTRGNSKLVSVLVGLLHAGMVFLTYWSMDRKARSRVFRECAFGIIMLTINLCFFGLNVGLDYAARMAALFGPYVILLIPQMLSLVESKTQRQNIAFLVALASGCQFVLRMCINNIGGTMPYRFFW